MEIDGLEIGKLLGKGAFAEVFLSKIQGKKELYATKKINKRTLEDERMKKYFKNEIQILKDIKHPNIIVLEDVKSSVYNFYLVFEYCNGGGLSDCLEKYKKKYNRPFTEKECQYLIKQIVSGLKYLHQKNILHRDLKLDNILVKFDNDEDKNNLDMLKATLKIIDFGFARYLEKDQLASSVLGTPKYMDPRILLKLRNVYGGTSFGYDQKADIWSLGTICYEMLIGFPPFEGDSYEELIDAVKSGKYDLPKDLKLSTECIAFLNSMLTYDPEKRKDINYLIKHPFLKKDSADLTKVLLKQSTLGEKNIHCNSKESNLWAVFDLINETDGEVVNPHECIMEVSSDSDSQTASSSFDIKEIDEFGEESEKKVYTGFLDSPDLFGENEKETNDTFKLDKIVIGKNKKYENKNIVIDAETENELNNAFDEINNTDFAGDMLCPISPDYDESLFKIE